MTPDYTTYSNDELFQAKNSINKDAYPDNYVLLIEEIKNRELGFTSQHVITEELINPFSNNIVETVEKDVERFKKFGGFLLFFKISVYVDLIVLTIFSGLGILNIVLDTFEPEISMIFVITAANAAILIPILFKLPVQHINTPIYIIKRLELSAVISAIFIVCYSIYFEEFIFTTLSDEYRSILYPLLWRQYFQTSKRVKTFYQEPKSIFGHDLKGWHR